MSFHRITLTVNGSVEQVDVPGNYTLLQMLREKLALTGTKNGCATGECGACTVIMDGKPMTSCLVLAAAADGRKITTIEGVAKDGQLHPLQQAFIEEGAIQCGYCTPGMILTAKHLLDKNPHPTEDEVRRAIDGNLCRCTGYVKIVKAILSASKEIKVK